MKERKYTVKLQRFNPDSGKYEPVIVVMSVAQATRHYQESVKAKDQAGIDRACAVLNAIREKAGVEVPVC